MCGNFIVGHIARYKYDQFSWTAKSSEFLEKQLKWGSLLFHLGIIPVFFGHVVGLAIPEMDRWTWHKRKYISLWSCLYW